MLLTAQRLGYRAAYRLIQVYWFVVRPEIRGVKVVIRSDDDVLFVRHTYGDDVWDLPGGSRRPAEDPLDAIKREAREELGLELTGWRQLGEVSLRRHATAVLTCFTAEYGGEPLKLRRREIAEARWAPASDPPRPSGKDVDMVLELL